ncbi:DNA polymerase III subunit gamma/tau [Neomegalonema sp.]|uniref:DNA polymerase III subunit gamma/tau n=1 Tax=Neomegalonema sp. TaxID=2039713 RepID=UPI0026202732|nr:DNA polymerase III subunit gamma/tau [Neomegalonema sp.]MDD2868972.1 DNA polymerase III subunit gamma/tau [Neomegalonema sp.]
MSGGAADGAESAGYLVLARKHRPQTFDALIGQEAMVRVLANAFATGRIAQAYVLTGVRGVGKTTTARIIARGLNCVGPDGTGGPTISPCGLCEPCRAIAEGRHVDVIEMDAASNTGVDSMREVIENTRYRPASARFKVYVVDEAHMLSTSAFNALLKTLEEPPPHVKFLFATTEIRKMPATILSRCQRFDLRRVSVERMTAYLGELAGREGAKLEPEALALIARASEGSVRDGLSILDQAIATAAGETAAAAEIRRMLGLADRARIHDLLDHILKGAPAEALAELRDQYAAGADPAGILRELAEAVHGLSVLKVSPEHADPALSSEAQARSRAMAEGLAMRTLTRLWQMLLKALEEADQAPSALMAAEMAVIRICWVADLPSPEEILKRLEAEGPAASPAGPSAPPGGGGGGARAALALAPQPLGEAAPLEAVAPQHDPAPQDLQGLSALLRAKKELVLALEVEGGLRPTRFEPGRILFAPSGSYGGEAALRLSQKLAAWTGRPWLIEPDEAAPTAAAAPASFAESRAAAVEALSERLRADPAVAALLAAFPGAELLKSAPPAATPAPADPPPLGDGEAPEDPEAYGAAFDDEAPWGEE